MAYLDELGLDVLWKNAKVWFARKLEVTQTGSNVSIAIQTEDEDTLDTVTLPEVTQEAPGLMSFADKTKLDGVEAGATANIGTITGVQGISPIVGGGTTGSVSLSHADSAVTPASYGRVDETPEAPAFGATVSVPGFQVDRRGHLIAAASHDVKIPNTLASTATPGLLSSEDKRKLNGIEAGATKNTAGPGIEITAAGMIKNAGVRDISSGTSNGTLEVDINGVSSEVTVAGLHSAAFTYASDYATAAQGRKADSAIQATQKGIPSGVATLDENGLVPASQLPSYVDDVVEYGTRSAFPLIGESGKIYVATDTNLTYRFAETTYVEISKSLALGTTSGTAYAGDAGKALADTIAAYGTATSKDFTNTVDNSDNADKLPTASAVVAYVAEHGGGGGTPVEVTPISEAKIHQICQRAF